MIAQRSRVTASKNLASSSQRCLLCAVINPLKKLDHRRVELVCSFHVGDMGDRQSNQPGSRNSFLQKLRVLERGCRIVIAGNYVSGKANTFHQLSLIHVAEGRAQQYVSPWIGSQQHRLQGSYRAWRCQPEGRREPALDYSLSDRSHSALLNSGNALVPRFQRTDPGCGVAQHKGFEAFGGVCSEPLPNDAANRQPTKMHLPNLKLIEKRQDILAESADRACGFPHIAFSVTTHIVAQEVKAALQRCQLWLP